MRDSSPSYSQPRRRQNIRETTHTHTHTHTHTVSLFLSLRHWKNPDLHSHASMSWFTAVHWV